MPLDELTLLAAIDAGRENAYGTDEQSALGVRRAAAIQAYLGLNTNPAPEGRSQIVDRTVYQTIHTILPSLIRIFAGSDESICKFLPVGPEDEAAAEQTTAVVQHYVTALNPWEQIFSDWAWNAAVMCNGYVLAYWHVDESTVRETYEGQSDDQAALLTQDDGVTVIQHSTRPDAEGNKMAQMAHQMAVQQARVMLAQGQQQVQLPPRPAPQSLHDIVIERKRSQPRVCLSVLPPEHCYVSIDTPNHLLDDCPYFEFRQEKTLSELREMGFDVPEDINDDDRPGSDEDDARDRFGEDRNKDDSRGAQRRVWTRMVWIQADAEGDRESRLYYCILVGRTILHAEVATCIPVASMTPQPLPHRHPGLSIAETVIDLQETKTAIKRGALDNLYLANNGRHLVSSRVNVDDMLDSRPGGLVRMLDDSLPAEGHMVPLVHPFAFDGIVGSLEYFDQDAQNRSGASRYFAGTDAGAINKTAAGTSMLQNAASQRVEHYARMMAPAVEKLFGIVHELVSKHENKPITIKLRGAWTTVDPQAWRTKRDVRISVGVGAGNKESLMLQLGQMLAAQLQLGPMLAGPQQIHATVLEMAKLAGFHNPQKFWVDPAGHPPQPPPPTPEQIKAQSAMQLEQFRASQEALKFQAQQEIERQKLQMQAELDRNREEMQARQKALEAQMQAQMEEARAAREAEATWAKLALEEWKAKLDAALQLHASDRQEAASERDAESVRAGKVADEKMVQTVQELMAAMEEMKAPAELVRGPDGRAIAVKRGSQVRQIVRDKATGRAIGLH